MVASFPGALGEREGLVGKGMATVERAAVGEFLTQDGGHVAATRSRFSR